MNLQLDKSNWEPVKFGDVVAEARATVRDPKAAGVERVVGLEHIEPECVHLRQWASIDEGTTFTKGFKKGHILFGRRRAYLKKAALADFDGICSGDITVLEAKERLLPELLPFLVCNDAFFDYAVKHSAGGLSPRTKFKDIANYEFLLPPKDQQAKLAELLWAADDSFEQASALNDSVHMALRVFRNTIFSKEPNNHKFGVANDPSLAMVKIGEILDPQRGMLNGIYKSKEFQGNGTRIINMKEMFAFPILENQEMELIQLTDKELSQFAVNEGDLIFARRSLVIEGAGKCAMIGRHGTPMVCESSIIRTRFDLKKVLPDYLFQFFLSASGRISMRRIVCFTTVAGIAGSDLKLMKIPIIDRNRQIAIVRLLAEFSPRIKLAENQMRNSKQLLKSLINEIFSQPA